MGGSGSPSGDDVWSSPDGVNWTEATSAAGWSGRNAFGAVAYNGQMWVMGGPDGGPKNDVWSSPDGTNWTAATSAAGWNARSGFPVVAFNSSMWVLGGWDQSTDHNDVWYATAYPNGTNITTTYLSFSPTTNSTFYFYQKQ
jgi:hypothetical protein